MLSENLLHYGRERLRVVHGQVGQYLAVEVNAVGAEQVHELGVGDAVLTSAGIDAGDPEAAESAFFAAAVAIGIAHCFVHCIFGYGEDIFARTEIAFGGFKDFFAPAPGGNGIH